MSVRGRGAARANVLWSPEDPAAGGSGTERKLERWVKRIVRRFRGHGTEVGLFLKAVGQQPRVLNWGGDMVGLPNTEKADCEGRG